MASSPAEPREGERRALERLTAARLEPLGWIRAASNEALLVRLDGSPDDLAVYKPDSGERPLWDFPPATLARRETAAFALSDWLGWDVVPATVYRDGPHGPGSVQRFVPHDPARHYFVLLEDESLHPVLRRVALFDLVTNNADRKASHVMLGPEGVRGCDHGLCFHVEPKLRTVIWDFAGEPIGVEDRDDLRRLADALDSGGGPALGGLLDPAECAALLRRTRALLGLGHLPDPPEDRRPYPWPLF
ncbi:MAG TPA: SCO1664 family protein [Egibacteraceae bacterium]|nr:SCO1664 family protein [Egibacteraceae bacterium]